jgi:phosphatidylglycerol:prolipoprotein diacylglycerol transferase
MHPILFHLPGLGWPVRMFGLYVISAFFIATLWAQFAYAALRVPAFAEEPGPRKAVRVMLLGIVLSRIAWILIPVDWGVRVVGVLAIDFLLAAFAWRAEARAFTKHPAAKAEADFVFNLGFWLLIIGFLGARLFWVFTTPDGRRAFAESPIPALYRLDRGGIVWYGGMICSAAFGAWYLWWKDRKIMQLGDILMTGIALTLFIGRWACLSVGDDYGRIAPEGLPWAVTFPAGVEGSEIPSHLRGVPLHPSQLYMSLNGLIIFAICLLVLRRKKFDGQVVWLMFMLYAIGRSIVEVYRGDGLAPGDEQGRGIYDVFGLTLSTSQIIGGLVFVFAAFMYLKGWLRHRRSLGKSASPGAEGVG